MEPKEEKVLSLPISIPLAIVLAGLIVSGSIIYSAKNGFSATAPTNQAQVVKQQTADLNKMRAISASDHIRGDINAPVKIVEYTDTECPFCKQFHATMKQVMAEYGDSGKVAWIYRNFPLESLHSKARSESVALECANELGGNDKFWQYVDKVYEITPSNNKLEATELPKIAKEIGLDVAKFNACLISGKYDKKITEDIQNATDTGGRGTPWSIVIDKNGKKSQLSGAMPFASVKQLIENALSGK